VVSFPQPGIYVGTLRHRRFTPTRHRFEYRLFMVLVDIDRLAELMAVSRLTGYNRPALAAFHDRDHFGDPTEPLRVRVARAAAEDGRTLPDGPILLLTHLRYAGYVFNPISMFYCFDRALRLHSVLAEVSNTFGGRRLYWLEGPLDAAAPLRARVDKDLYVSPFMPYCVSYDFVVTPPGERLVVHMNVDQRDGTAAAPRTFDATLRLQYRPWTAAQMRRTLLQFPWMTARVIAAIHWEAFRLWRKGLAVQPIPHPEDRHRRKGDADVISRFLGRAGRLARVRGH
jgi:DUF1365 family protein